MKKQIFTIILMLLTIPFISSCQEIPKELEKNEENQAEVQKTAELEFDTIKNIFSKMDDTLSKEYKNIKFDKKFDIDEPEEIGRLQFVQIGDFLDKTDKIFSHYADKYNEKYKYTNPRTVPPGPEYSNKKTGEYMGIGDDGFFNYEKSSTYVSNETDKTVFVRGEYKDESFRVSDGKMKISEAVRLAESYAKEWKSLSGEISEWKPYTVTISPSNIKNEYFFAIDFTKSYKSVSFLSLQKRRFFDNESTETSYGDYYPSFVIIDSSSKIAKIVNTSGVQKYEKTMEKYDKIITLDCAINLFENKMADYKMNEVVYVDLSYRMIQKENTTNGDFDISAGIVSITSPCWVFCFEPEIGKEEFAQVDCITGEVVYVNNNL